VEKHPIGVDVIFIAVRVKSADAIVVERRRRKNARGGEAERRRKHQGRGGQSRKMAAHE
jgi:hypothetical protein